MASAQCVRLPFSAGISATPANLNKRVNESGVIGTNLQPAKPSTEAGADDLPSFSLLYAQAATLSFWRPGATCRAATKFRW